MKNNQLIITNENTFVGKIKNFFHKLKIKLFGYKENNKIEDINGKNNIVVHEEKKKFLNELKNTSTDNVIEKNNFLEEIKGNREALDMLSTDRLRKLSKYYDEVIEKNNNLINKLKKSV